MSTPDASPENTSPVQPRDEIPEEEDSDDEREHSVETDHWKCDLRRVVWNEGGPEWEQNIIDDGQFRELMEVEPTPYVRFYSSCYLCGADGTRLRIPRVTS